MNICIAYFKKLFRRGMLTIWIVVRWSVVSQWLTELIYLQGNLANYIRHVKSCPLYFGATFCTLITLWQPSLLCCLSSSLILVVLFELFFDPCGPLWFVLLPLWSCLIYSLTIVVMFELFFDHCGPAN